MPSFAFTGKGGQKRRKTSQLFVVFWFPNDFQKKQKKKSGSSFSSLNPAKTSVSGFKKKKKKKLHHVNLMTSKNDEYFKKSK